MYILRLKRKRTKRKRNRSLQLNEKPFKAVEQDHFTRCKGIRTPIKFLSCGITNLGNLSCGTGILGFGIRNPTNNQNPESKFHWLQNPVPGIWNHGVEYRIQGSDILTWGEPQKPSLTWNWTVNFVMTGQQLICHFRVPKTLTFEMRPSAQPFLWKWVLFT